MAQSAGTTRLLRQAEGLYPLVLLSFGSGTKSLIILAGYGGAFNPRTGEEEASSKSAWSTHRVPRTVRVLQ